MLSPVFPVLIQGEIHSPEIQPQKNGVFFQSSQGWTFIYPDYPDCFFFLKSCWMIGGKSIDPLIHWWWMIQWLLVESWWIPWSGWIPLAQYKSWWFRVPPPFFLHVWYIAVVLDMVQMYAKLYHAWSLWGNYIPSFAGKYSTFAIYLHPIFVGEITISIG